MLYYVQKRRSRDKTGRANRGAAQKKRRHGRQNGREMMLFLENDRDKGARMRLCSQPLNSRTMTTAKTNNALSALLLFLLLMTINGCEQETEKEIDSWRKNQTEKTLSDIEFAKKWYQNNVQSGKILLQTDSPTLRASGDTAFFFTNPTWKYYAVNQNGKIKAVDVDLTDSIYTEFVPEENDKAYEETKDWKYRRSYSRMTILQSLQTQQTIGFIMTIIPSPRYVDNRYDRIRFITYLNREPDFDGIILFHNIDGSFSNGWIYENGKVSKRIIEHDADCINNNPSLSINLFKVKYSVRVKEESQDNFRSGEETYDGGTLPEVECVAPYIKRKGYATYDYIYYIENQNNSGIQHQVWWMQEDNLYEGGGGYGPAPQDTEEVIMDSSFKNTKAECVYNKLMSLSGGFKKAIQKFDGKFPVSHLRFKVIPTLPNGYNAQTLPPEDYLIEIQFNQEGLNRPNLSIARTIIHETIHAEIFRKLLSIANNNGHIDVNDLIYSLTNNDFPGLLDYYIRYGPTKYQHEQMAQHYRSTIISVLKEFDSSQPSDVYESLSWVGLYGTVAWENKSAEFKNKMKSVLSEFSQKGVEPCQ